jgi:hypothetical protein
LIYALTDTGDRTECCAGLLKLAAEWPDIHNVNDLDALLYELFGGDIAGYRAYFHEHCERTILKRISLRLRGEFVDWLSNLDRHTNIDLTGYIPMFILNGRLDMACSALGSTITTSLYI